MSGRYLGIGMASCAIPGWYQPVRVADRRYIDGGAWSSTNLDLMAGQGLDEVFVLAPSVSFVRDAPSTDPTVTDTGATR